MVKLIKHTLNMLSRTQNNILSAASVIMVTVMLSRVLGLLRDRILAGSFSPEELGVYYAAFRIPNMIFELLVMGVMATAFIPVFTSYLDTKNKDNAFEMASQLINAGVIIFFIFSLPIVIFAGTISKLLAPGFNKDQIDLMASFTRIMILAQVFPLIIGNFFTGILQSYRSFIIPSIAPVVYNIGIIIGTVLLTPLIGLYAPVIGVVIGSLLFVFVQLPLILSFGYKHKLSFSFNHPGLKEVTKLMLPRTFGLAVSQIDTTVDLILSTLLGAASVTIFNFAQHLQQMPVGLFGASIAQATLPMLSSLHAKRSSNEYKTILLSAFHQILFTVIPLSAILIVLRIPIVRLVFGASTLFDWEATVMTGKTLAFFSFSLFAQALIHLLARAFYAVHDSKTPVAVGTICVILNAVLSLVFVLYFHLEVWSMGLSTSISSILNMLILLYFLDRKINYFNRYELFITPLKILLSGLVSGIALYIPIKLLDQLVFDTTRTINLLFLTLISSFFGLSVYLFLVWFLEVPQTSIIVKVINRMKNYRKGVFMDTTSEVVNVPEREI